MSHRPKDDLWSAPIKRKMLAGFATCLPLIANFWNIHIICYRPSPSCHCSRTYFTSRSIDRLNSFARRSGRTGQRFSLGDYLCWYLGAPIAEILSYFKFDRGIFKSTDFSNKIRNFSHESPSLPSKNHIQRLSLLFIGALVKK